MKNREVKNLMIMNYGHRCFCNGKITKSNPLTYHHIKPVRKKGKATEENGALLCRMEHDQFNIIEFHFPEIAERLNKMFQLYKQNPTEEQRQYMRFILLTTFDNIECGKRR